MEHQASNLTKIYGQLTGQLHYIVQRYAKNIILITFYSLLCDVSHISQPIDTMNV